MRSRSALIGLTMAAAALALSACSLLPKIAIPGGEHTPSPSVTQHLDADGFTAAQETLIGELFTATTGKPGDEAKSLLRSQYAALGKKYVSAAEPLCKVSPTIRESAATHDGFVAGVKKTAKLSDATVEKMWSSIIAYCKTEG